MSGIYTHVKNEGAFDDVNPVQDARIPRNAREPGETFAYNLNRILRILEVLPLLPKAVIATASFAGLREGELRGIEWTGYTGDLLSVNRSIWKSVVNRPKTRASLQAVPVIRPAVEAIRLEWYGWHGFRRGIASNLYELGASEKVVQRILRHAKPHVTKERYTRRLILPFWRR